MNGVQPTLSGFQTFITNVVKIPSTALSPTDPLVGYCYDFAVNWVYQQLQCVPSVAGAWSLYAVAVYNLAADTLINWGQDAPGAPVYKNDMAYFAYTQGFYGTASFTPGLIQSASDESTSAGYMIPDAFKGMTIANLQNLKTPWGRTYLGIAQSWGPNWGLS